MDTWATSSLTPQIAASWELDNDLFNRVFPMDLRPQSHEIIRTWLFSTLVRSHLEENSLPWKNASISGWILDPDRKKMSKSKGNVVTPIDLLEEYGSDAVRYWAAMGRPGTDTAFDTGQMKIGKRLAIKLLNASKFSLSLNATLNSDDVTQAVDHALLNKLAQVVETATSSFDKYDYTRALEVAETFFWAFTDDYVELVKTRGYLSHTEEGAMSARAALRRALSTLQRLLAPLLPFVTEEVWSWWQSGSVHQSQWPTTASLTDGLTSGPNEALLDAICGAIGVIRRAKTEAKVSQRAVVTEALFVTSIDAASAITAGWADIADAGSVEKWSISTADTNEITVNVTLAPNIQQA